MADMQSFIFGGNTGINSHAELQRTRNLAEAIQKSRASNVAKTPWEGINNITQALVARQLGERADTYESEQRTAANETFAGLFADGADPSLEQLSGIMGNEYVTDGQQALVNAILSQRMREDDPLYQLNLEKGNLEIEGLRNPAWEPPKLTEIYDDDTGRPVKGYMTQEGFEPVGGVAAPKDPLVTVNTGEPSDGKLRESLDKKEGEQWSAYKATGATSAANAQDFQVLDELIGIAPQGPITGRLAEMFPGFNSAGDAFTSIVKRIAPTLRAPGSGSTSDIEYDGMLRSLPALKNSPEGNRMILSIMQEKAALNVKRAEIITQYQTGSISAAQARNAIGELDQASILTPEMQSALNAISGPQQVGADGGVIPSGVDPDVWEYMTPEERALWQN